MTGWTKDRIVRAMAREAAQRLSRQAIARLKKMGYPLSGYDSGLKSVWDEICVQVQGDQSPLWDAYEQAMRDVLDISELPVYEQQALWLQTPAGEDWDFKNDQVESDEPPVFHSDIVHYLIRDHVLAEARRWSNPRIRAFLDRTSMRD